MKLFIKTLLTSVLLAALLHFAVNGSHSGPMTQPTEGEVIASK